jgi:GGDEF domain-containing protein
LVDPLAHPRPIGAVLPYGQRLHRSSVPRTSIGIATAPLAASFAPAERELIDDLVNLADTARYAAKHAGGNQSRSAHMPHADLKGSPA